MFWRLVIAVLAVIAAGAVFYLRSTEGRQLLDRLWINADRMENRALHQAGKRLPGTPDLARLDERLAAKGVQPGDPVFFRIFKLESELELWMAPKGGSGEYVHVATYPICYWSGRLGPKIREGDLQAPEGYYTVDKATLNPNSRWHRSFNLGFPNAFDAAHGRSGSFLMVHGGCASVGCYAMTDAVVSEIWQLVTAALDAGQPRFAVLALPFRLSGEALDARRGYSSAAFWRDLKQGSDLFERTHLPPVASVCDRRYAFTPGEAGAAVPPIEESCPAPLASSR